MEYGPPIETFHAHGQGSMPCPGRYPFAGLAAREGLAQAEPEAFSHIVPNGL
jgi:hypothetical protein